ncbi:M23 family metallopeptidase [Nocardioides sp. KC13]|uniref:M23 family metallopeptidase n=1 Tax=Nocardioides turkmenicus TaxID=2711220 RepID=A0A6M1RHS5_9ACTN|nr:M23 family metallopeptidase [Nocardioides sp. KC13]
MPKAVTTANDLNALVTPPLPRGTYTDLHNFGDTSRHWTRWHTGTDLSAPCGTPVLAATAGMVIIETGGGWSGRWLVKVTTGNGKVTTWYGHMQGLTVEGRQIVRAGQQIGYVGSEGNSTGCHLHFEVHANGGGMYQDNVNPSMWLARYVGNAPSRSAVQSAGIAQTPETTQTKVPGAYAVPRGAVGEQQAVTEPIGLGSLLSGGGKAGS